ncbi:MAG: TOBE domain-containing protein, partial [Scytonema sp. PMC 1069.18]|nr:TOBE domain-containing protein [Scytonema sp. PMC 1069.18]
PIPSQGDLMIREEDIILQSDSHGSIVIETRHFLGREYRYGLRTPSGKTLYARTPATIPLPIGTYVQLSVKEQGLKFFPL